MPTRGVPEHGNLSRDGAESYDCVFHRLQVCLISCSWHRGTEWELIDYANCRHERMAREKETERNDRES